MKQSKFKGFFGNNKDLGRFQILSRPWDCHHCSEKLSVTTGNPNFCECCSHIAVHGDNTQIKYIYSMIVNMFTTNIKATFYQQIKIKTSKIAVLQKNIEICVFLQKYKKHFMCGYKTEDWDATTGQLPAVGLQHHACALITECGLWSSSVFTLKLTQVGGMAE